MLDVIGSCPLPSTKRENTGTQQSKTYNFVTSMVRPPPEVGSGPPLTHFSNASNSVRPFCSSFFLPSFDSDVDVDDDRRRSFQNLLLPPLLYTQYGL